VGGTGQNGSNGRNGSYGPTSFPRDRAKGGNGGNGKSFSTGGVGGGGGGGGGAVTTNDGRVSNEGVPGIGGQGGKGAVMLYFTTPDKLNTPTLYVNGNATISNECTATKFTTLSDYRIKENITPLDLSVLNIDKLRPVMYNNINTKTQDVGLIAHELQELYPFLVSGVKDGEQLQSVNYIGLIAILIKEIQELKNKVQKS
jgi:hypothetical protein